MWSGLWTEAVYSTYPFETTGFLRTKQDAFGNPVANMTKEAAGTLYDAVAGEEVEVATVKNALERFVKLRAVQTFTPSQGLGVFYLMKPLLRERILPELAEQGELDAYLTAESRLDSLALLAFDIYTAARETLAESQHQGNPQPVRPTGALGADIGGRPGPARVDAAAGGGLMPKRGGGQCPRPAFYCGTAAGNGPPAP